MSTATVRPRPYTHGLRPMLGRDPHDGHRAATPLELLYDLVFVISFGVAGNEGAHLVAEGYWTEGLLSFSFAMFAVIWAWINFTWFASAFDTDDWIYRLLVMIQMVGVTVLALGLPAMFDSIHHHEAVDNRAMVIGYVVMRLPMIALWIRVALQDHDNRRNARTYITTLTIAQIGWCALLFLDAEVGVFFALAAPLFLIELGGPVLAERREGGTPWHAHHIAERYGLLAIISFGEILIGTVAALNSVLELEGWGLARRRRCGVRGRAHVRAVVDLFQCARGEALHHRREVSFLFGYGHLIVYAAIAAVGAGLHVAALHLEHHASISEPAVMAAVAVPTALCFLSFSVIHAAMVAKLALCAASVAAVGAGLDLVWGIGVLLLAPIISVVGQELIVGRQRDRTLDDLTVA